MTRTSRFRACDLCEAICGLEFQFEGDELVAIRGDAKDPFSRGHICPKGNAILDLESDPDRLRRPLRRRGGDWEEIGWDEAYAEAAERLASIRKAHGGDAIGAYLGNPNVHHFGHIAYLPSLLRRLKTRNVFSASSVDQWPHQLVARLMYGHQFLLPIPDIDRTDYLLMLGANPVASNGSLMTAPGVAKRLKALAARGRLVVIDPRRTETAEIASEHHFVRPGADAWFLIALLRELARCGPPRLERYGERIADFGRALDALSSFDLDEAARRCGIARDTCARIAAELYAAPTTAVYGRVGVSTQAFGTLCQWLIQLANLYCGRVDREGGVLCNEAAIPLTGPGTSRGQRARWASRVRGLPEFAGELPVAVLAEEIDTPGAGQIRALVTVAGNPVLSTPNGRALSESLSRLEFMLSIDIYLNETTRHAHLILPPASSLTQDHYDLIFNALAVRRVARLSQPLHPRGEDERADWEIVNGLGAALERAGTGSWQALPEPRALIAAGLARGKSGVDLAALEGAPHGLDLGPLRPSLLDRLETESGRIECAPELVMGELDRLRAAECGAMPPDALLLIGRREVRSNNSWMHNAPRLIKGKPRHQLMAHPDDLGARGLAGAARVRVRSAAGAVETEVLASDEVMRGVVCLPHGYGHALDGVRLSNARGLAGASYNDLSDPAALDVPSGNAALNGVPVWLEPASG